MARFAPYSWLVVALLPLLVLASADADEEGLPSFVLPGTEVEVDRGQPAVESVLVVRRVGPGRFAPLEGVRVRCFTEDCRGASLGAVLVAEGRTNEHGVALLEAEAGSGEHWLFDAPGYGTKHEYCGFGYLDEDPVVLAPAPNRPLQILDPFGQPLEGAHVEVVMGCGHSPAAQEGVTDEGGLVTLGPVDDDYYDLWITAPGVRPDRYSLPPVPTDGSVPSILTEPAQTARGVVVDAAGRPVAGATVRELDRFRGPKAGTDAEGRFELHGLTGEEAIAVYLPDPPFDEAPAIMVDAFAPDMPLRLVLDTGRATALGDGEPRHRLDVVLEGANSLVPIECTRTTDGFTVRAESNLWRNTFDLPPGRYRITVGGLYSYHTPHAFFALVPVPEGMEAPLKLEGAAAVFLLDVPPAFRGKKAELRIPGHAEKFDLGGSMSWLPATGPAALVVQGTPSLLFPLPEAKADEGWRTADLVLPEPTTFLFRVTDEEGHLLEPVLESELDLELRRPAEKERLWSVATYEEGEIEFALTAEGYETRDVLYVLPSRSRSIELGDLVLRKAREPTDADVTLLDSRGEPIEEADVRLGEQQGEENVHDDTIAGHYVATLITPTRDVVVHARGFFPMPVTLIRGRAQTLQFPAGRLEIEVKDEDGALLPAVVWLDGHRFDGDEGVVRIDGVPAGDHVLLVGATGKEGRAVPVSVGSDALRIEVRL